MKDPADTDIEWSIIAGAIAICIMLCGIGFGILLSTT